MPEAVIVATARTPIGRAVKGSLKEVRPDDLAAFIIGTVLSKVAQLDSAVLDDLSVGCAEPEGEQGLNMARRIAVQLGYDRLPASTVEPVFASALPNTPVADQADKGRRGA